jgi:polysaccharide pyruvyl transferase WcaK-like protein
MVSVRSGNTLDNGKTDYDERVISELSLAVKSISEKYSYTPIFVPFQSEVDDDITAKVREYAGCGIIMPKLSASELCGILKRCELAISMRLHLLIFAASCSVPMIGLSYDKKVDSFMRYVGEKELCDVRSFTSDTVVKLAENIVDNSAELRERLEEKSSEFADLTNEDAKIIVSML